MSKQKPSKLDPFAERLTQWFTPKDKGGDGLTLAEAQAQLKLDGCSVSPARLSLWWAARQQEFLRDTLLGQIASGARQCAAVEKSFAKNPAPELETLIKLQRVILLNLSTQANVDPSLLDLIGNSFKAVLTAEKLKLQRESLSLDREKFELESAALMLDQALRAQADEINASGLSQAAKLAAMR